MVQDDDDSHRFVGPHTASFTLPKAMNVPDIIASEEGINVALFMGAGLLTGMLWAKNAWEHIGQAMPN